MRGGGREGEGLQQGYVDQALAKTRRRDKPTGRHVQAFVRDTLESSKGDIYIYIYIYIYIVSPPPPP